MPLTFQVATFNLGNLHCGRSRTGIAIAHDEPVDDQQDDRAEEGADEARRLVAAVDAECPSAIACEQRAGDAERGGDEKAAGILPRHDKLRKQPHDESDHDGPDDAHRLLRRTNRWWQDAAERSAVRRGGNT